MLIRHSLLPRPRVECRHGPEPRRSKAGFDSPSCGYRGVRVVHCGRARLLGLLGNGRMTDRKKPGWAFWTTVVLSLPVLYVLSLAPMAWIAGRADSGRFNELCEVVYDPLFQIGHGHAPEPVLRALIWYHELLLPEPPPDESP